MKTEINLGELFPPLLEMISFHKYLLLLMAQRLILLFNEHIKGMNAGVVSNKQSTFSLVSLWS